jgi:hypothetical protein
MNVHKRTASQSNLTAEHKRLGDSFVRRADWKNWGPYLSERAWGTVREDYSPSGDAWGYFPHDHARSRAYRWNEDGLGGFCNRLQNICLGVALWNESDPYLKERLFGLSGPEGNHGEDVKEYYFYLDGLPSHAYMKMLYKYPQSAFPYDRLVSENTGRSRLEPEFELIDALRGDFEANRYFDVFIEYAKTGQEDFYCQITVINRSSQIAPVHVLPHLWYRNTWSWGYNRDRPVISEMAAGAENSTAAHTASRHLGERWWYTTGQIQDSNPDSLHENKTLRADLLFTENETNFERLYGTPNPSPYVKDSIHQAVIRDDKSCVNPESKGSKAAAHYAAQLSPHQALKITVRFSDRSFTEPFSDSERIFVLRQVETDQFYASIQGASLGDDERRIHRQALAGLLWSKQFYHYSVELWLKGDPAGPNPPDTRLSIRNSDWQHLYNLDVLSMPDKWEYPWFAAWDLAFHTLPIALVDQEWAKRQLVILLREWYMHPNGQLPAYEWDFNDVNPPVHAWAAMQVYKIDRDINGSGDIEFLEKVFHKLLLNFTWWVNREDLDGNNVFQGGFLGLDNIGVFDRSKPIPGGSHLDQADGTAWMGMYCLNMLTIALEIAQIKPAYEDVATKFFEHFIYIVNAFYNLGGHGLSLWDEKDGFFYDVMHTSEGAFLPLKIRSFVGLIPLFATTALEHRVLDKLPRFKRRMQWFIKYRPQLIDNLPSLVDESAHDHYQISILDQEKLARVLPSVFDPDEFLSDFGIRSLSRHHLEQPFEFSVGGVMHSVHYEPAESSSGLFGGNSNWRGPVWFPLNYLVIESLRKYARHYGEEFKIEVPRGSGVQLTLDQAADELCRRLVGIFLSDPDDRRPVFGFQDYFQSDPHWRDYIPFYEYFHGENGCGLGASHQTGWTALVAKLIQEASNADS